MVQVAALLWFRATDWYAWQRGLTDPVDDGLNGQVNVAEVGPGDQLRR